MGQGAQVFRTFAKWRERLDGLIVQQPDSLL